jgi:hypothetical protein
MSVNRRQLAKLAYVVDALYIEAMHSPVMKKQAKEDLRSGFLVTAMEEDEEGEEGEEGEYFYFDEEDGVEESGDESEDFEDSLRRWSKSTDPDVRMDVVKMTNDVELLEHLSQAENKLVRHNALKKLEKLM